MWQRRSDDQVATLGEIHKAPGWVWVYCEKIGCRHKRAVPLAPFVIRYGARASGNRLRRALRCTRCGAKGATIQMPSWVSLKIGSEAFPPEMALEGRALEKDPMPRPYVT